MSIQKLHFDNVIPYYKSTVTLRKHKLKDSVSNKNSTNTNEQTIFNSIAFKFQTVKGMVYLYDYFIAPNNRLYSDFKFYRVTKIKKFISIRDLKNEPKDSVEFKIYSDFVLDWIQYRNPIKIWYKVPFV